MLGPAPWFVRRHPPGLSSAAQAPPLGACSLRARGGGAGGRWAPCYADWRRQQDAPASVPAALLKAPSVGLPGLPVSSLGTRTAVLLTSVFSLPSPHLEPYGGDRREAASCS